MNGEVYDIVIIGAGVAGLSVAYNLRKLAPHLNVVILEARDRIGGRVKTEEFAFIKVDVGAAFIHNADKRNPIFNIARDLKLKLHNVDWDDLNYYGEYAKLSLVQQYKIYKDFSRLAYDQKARKKYLTQDEIYNDAPLSVVFERFKEKSKYNQYELAFFDLLIEGDIESDYAENTTRLSALNYDQDEDGADKDNIFIANDSYQSIINHLSEGHDIKLNKVVKQIYWNTELNRVTCENDEIFCARLGIVCTLPLGVLKKNLVQFTPPLPEEKVASIEKLGISVLNIILIEFRRCFWPKKKTFFANLSPNSPEKFCFVFNLLETSGKNILKIYLGSDQARSIETLSDEDILMNTLENLHSMFKCDMPHHRSFYVTRWNQDPFSFGSYSNIPIGATGDEYDTLSETLEDKLFFAGEATYRAYPSTVHGAFLSGEREALKIATKYALP